MLVKIEAYFDGEFWCARGIGEDIFTQGNTLDELHQNIIEAVSAHYGEADASSTPYNNKAESCRPFSPAKVL